jgi:DNA-binding SARP family transcriptional activator/tetratricopeptide (TPR) repeat protein
MLAKKSTRPGLAIYLFGRPELRRVKELLPPLATQKTQSLLAYLILHCDRSHLRDELAALFWGDRDDVHARHSLTTALWRIRRLLGKNYLLADSTSVQFDPASPFWLDVTEFEQRVNESTAKPGDLAMAVQLYRGDLLEGFYDNWCIEERYRLEALYLDALRRLVDWHAAQGDAREVLAYAQKYLAHDPLMENIHLAAMRALASLGDLTGARRQWQLCCETRQRELHALPSPEMLEQAESLLGAQFTIPLPVEPLPVRAPPRWDSLERPPFVGRAREMDALRARWEQAAQGQGGMVLIGGEAGVGKTRLTEEFAVAVRWHGGMVARGRCYEPERLLPHQLLAEILHDLSLQEEHASLALPAWARAELARLVPELVPPPFQPVPSTGSLQPERQAILFHAIAAFIRQFASRRPLLIVLEDLHWATDSTLAAIHYLARQTADLRVLCLSTYRPEEAGKTHALTKLAGQLAREGLAQHLALERLPLEAIAELVRHTFEAEAGFVNRLYAHAEGNAFFSIETLRALAGAPLPEGPLPVPGNVRALIDSRLGNLSAPAHEWITFAAVAGRTFDLDLLCRARGMDEDAALAAIDELLRQGFLCEGSGITGYDYEFVHHLVYETTYTGIHHRRRRRLHRLIGEAMESLYADQPAIAGELAHHFEAGGELEKSLHYHGIAAQQAAAVFAWQEAEEHQSRMLQLLEKLDPDRGQADYLRRRGRILADRVELRFLQARLAERDADLAALGALAEASGDDYLHLQALTQRARYLNLDAQYEQAIVAAEEGLVLADYLKNTAARGYLLTQIGFAHYFLGQPQPALAALDSALAMTPEADGETRRHITHILGYVHFHLGNYARSIAYQQEAYAIHQAFHDYNGLAWAGLDIAATCLEMGRLSEAGQYLTEHLDLARRIGARSAEAYGLIQSGSWELGRGNYTAALELFHQALSTQQELRTEHGRVAAEIGNGIACYHLGDTVEARRWLEQAVARARPIQHRRRLAEALIGLGIVELIAGQPSAAHGCLTEAVAVARNSEARGNLAAGLAALARAERRLGDLTLALNHASEAVQVAVEIAVPVCEMWGELEMGLARLARGDPEAAQEHTRRAVDLASPNNERWIGSEQVHRAHARVLRTIGSDEAADEQEELAKAILAAKAGCIPDPQQRRRYLESRMCDP